MITVNGNKIDWHEGMTVTEIFNISHPSTSSGQAENTEIYVMAIGGLGSGERLYLLPARKESSALTFIECQFMLISLSMP
ncbi:MAG: hypothetical protein BWY64_01436 [bacterium ADurb.Bin363]|nr:MAG: hypothetical protein BWY64_01436 [bacterium ADurb.Bin363]